MPLLTERECPRVPNHQLLRVIGRGAYGEIWLARSLTGALRAVKIVDERTFENEKAFQREFEGMARFEPISRSDAGFVDILHVGREEGGHFFYYVMELADDVTGAEVPLADYAPRTLRSELRRRPRLLVAECIAIGLSLTRALGVLHRHGLVHRDIKPANVIFVGGVPKIADIGLVAASGQASFVGTEGYVPPEGPGSVQADLFSLGKVLYEMAMGRDRLDFPALDSNFTALPEKRPLLQINALLLRACAPDPRERYASAEEMHADLERLRAGRALAPRHRRLGSWAGVAFVLALSTAGVAGWARQHRPGALEVRSEPPGAMVLLESDGTMRRSPARFEQVKPGTQALRVMLPGYDAQEVRTDVVAGGAKTLPVIRMVHSEGQLELGSAPPGVAWTLRQQGEVVSSGSCPAVLPRLPTGEYEVVFTHEGVTQKQQVEISREERATARAEFLRGQIRIASEPAGAAIELDGKPVGETPLDLTLAQGEHHFTAHYRSWPVQQRPMEIQAARSAELNFAFARGSAKISSAPAGATVMLAGRELGRAPLLLEDLEPGAIQYELRLPGYKPALLSGEIKPGEQTFLGGRLTQHAGPQRGQPWENSLSMKFVPVGRVLLGQWPVRVRDYDAFCVATGRTRTLPDFVQDGTHPIVRVNLEDASEFCEWLTQHEAHGGSLEAGQRYRLPTDVEWSEGAGLPPESGDTPEQRDGKLPDFPWGRQWPPPAGSGNFADATLRKGAARIPGYRDGFAQTSPVGSFPANKLGLQDMSGNVWQWVQDSYKGGAPGKDWGVLRGGSWGTSAPAELRSAYRNVVDRGERDVIFGFRVALVPEE